MTDFVDLMICLVVCLAFTYLFELLPWPYLLPWLFWLVD